MTDEPTLETNDEATPQEPDQRTLSPLQAFDLGALDSAVVCAIDDPDCDAPAAAPGVVIEALASRNTQPSATAPTTAEA